VGGPRRSGPGFFSVRARFLERNVLEPDLTPSDQLSVLVSRDLDLPELLRGTLLDCHCQDLNRPATTGRMKSVLLFTPTANCPRSSTAVDAPSVAIVSIVVV